MRLERRQLWDEWEFMDRHGSRPHDALDDAGLSRDEAVVCRECGSVAEGSLQPHLAGSHGTSAEEYGEEWPEAPLEPPENPRRDDPDGPGVLYETA